MATGALPGSEQRTAVAAADFRWDGHGFEAGVGIAASGGGFRAMLFHAGAFQRLAELGLLAKARRISSVSGGSIAAAYLACVWDRLTASRFADIHDVYVRPIVAFSAQRLDVIDALAGLPPWTSAAKEVASSLETLFQRRTLQALPDSVEFVLCATNLQTGVLWRFAKAYAGDYVVGRLANPDLQLAEAVAASAAFPPFLSPMELDFAGDAFTDWPDQTSPLSAQEIVKYRRNVFLSDGGVYDNHGVEPIVKRFATLFVSDGGAPFQRQPDVHGDWLRQMIRIGGVVDNQVRALRRRDLLSRLTRGEAIGDEAKIVAEQSDARLGSFWGIDTDPAKAAPAGALPCDPAIAHELSSVSTRLSDPGADVAKRLVNWGYAISDRCIRKHYHGALTNAPPQWPFPDEPLG